MRREVSKGLFLHNVCFYFRVARFTSWCQHPEVDNSLSSLPVGSKPCGHHDTCSGACGGMCAMSIRRIHPTLTGADTRRGSTKIRRPASAFLEKK